MWSIVVAGGSGRRFGQLKQYALLGGRPVLQWAVAACRTCSAGVVLVVPDGEGDHDPHGADAVVSGGPTRADSVRRGLAAVPADAAVIVVHDAARPLASPALFAAVVAAVTDGGADGAVPGVPPSDTIKAVDESGQRHRAPSTAPRWWPSRPRRPSGPPCCDGPTMAASTGATDDAMLVEALGGTVQVVPGEPANLKITDPGDLGAAERLLAAAGGVR